MGTSKSLSSCGSGAVPGGSGGPGSGTGLPARCEPRKPKTKHCVKIYLVFTLYIPGIYLNKGKYIVNTWYIPDIYKVYTWYTSMLVYTWYIPGICRLYDHIGDIPGVCHAKTSMHLFGTSHVPTFTSHIPWIYQVYDQLRGVRDWYRTSASKFLCGIYLLYRRH